MSSDAYSGVQSLLRVSSVLGVCPIRLEGRVGCRSITAPASLRVYGASLCLLVVCCHSYGFNWAISTGMWHSSVYTICLLMSSPVQILTYALAVLATLSRWRSVRRVANSLCTLSFSESASRFCAVQTAALFAFVSADHLITFPAAYEPKHVFCYLSSFVCAFSGLFVVIQYTTFVHLLEIQARDVNTELRRMVTEATGRRLRRGHRVRSAAVAQNALCKAAEDLNSAYGPQLLSQLARCYVQVVFALYNLLTVSLRSLDTSRHSDMLASGTPQRFVFVFAGNTVMVWWLLYVAERARRQGKNMGPLVHELMNTVRSQEIKQKLKAFSLQLLHRRIHFTACGLFPVDYTVLLSLIGASTTYLLILIQFQVSYGRYERANSTSIP